MNSADVALVWLVLFMLGYALVLIVIGTGVQLPTAKPCDCPDCPTDLCDAKEDFMDEDIEKQVQEKLVESSIQAAILRNMVPHLAFMARRYATRNHPNVAEQYNEMARELQRLGIRLKPDAHDGLKVFAEPRQRDPDA